MTDVAAAEILSDQLSGAVLPNHFQLSYRSLNPFPQGTPLASLFDLDDDISTPAI